MKISGSGRLSEGTINDELAVSGSAKIEGNFECNGFRSSGSLRGEGDLIVHGDVRSSGSFKLRGSLRGDGNFRSSGSASIDGETIIHGTLSSSGSLRLGNKAEALQGVRSSGSFHIQGELLSHKIIEIEGTLTAENDIKGEDVFFGTTLVRARKIFKHPFRIFGSILAKNRIDITGARVEQDVKGRHVIIGRGTEVLGTVYYVETIEVHKQANLSNEPIQIKVEDLGF
ncbi:MAG: hypothetical protein ACFFG0_30105 [Candidatus Thorarchaeota archaeon]